MKQRNKGNGNMENETLLKSALETIKTYAEGGCNFEVTSKTIREHDILLGCYKLDDNATSLSRYRLETNEKNHVNELKLYYFCCSILKLNKVKFTPTNHYYENLKNNRVVSKEFLPLIHYFEHQISEEQLLKQLKKMPDNEVYFTYGYKGKLTQPFKVWYEENKDAGYVTSHDIYKSYKLHEQVKKWMNEGKVLNFYQIGKIAKWAMMLKNAWNLPCVAQDDVSKKVRVVSDLDLSYVTDGNVDDFIAAIINEMPKHITSVSEMKKHVKSKLKELYFCENGKTPKWEQDSEWLYDEDGMPMIFVSSKRSGEKVTYTFKNRKTNQLHEVVQFG